MFRDSWCKACVQHLLARMEKCQLMRVYLGLSIFFSGKSDKKRLNMIKSIVGTYIVKNIVLFRGKWWKIKLSTLKQRHLIFQMYIFFCVLHY